MTGDLAAVVLAAGRGNRLRPLSDHLPKALCPVNNVALVDLALDRVRPYTNSIAVNVHHGRDAMLAHLDGRVHVSLEKKEALGTAGALGLLRAWIDQRGVLVANADAWSCDDLGELLRGWDGERVRLLVKRDESRPDFVGGVRFAGASVMPWQVVRELRAEPSGLYEVCWRDLENAGRLDFCVSEERFVDCGTPADYLAANLAASGGGSVIGAGAVVDGEIVRSVVWPGGVVRAGERLVDSIRVGADLTVDARGTTA